MKSKFTVLCLVLLMLVPAFGSAQAQRDTLTIGLSLPTFEEQYYLTLVDSAVAAAEEAEASVSVMYADFNTELELENVESLIADEVDLLLLMPVDRTASADAIAAANEADIPVILLAYEMTTMDDIELAGFVAPQPEDQGMAAASFMCERLEDGGRVLELIDFSMDTEDDIEENAEREDDEMEEDEESSDDAMMVSQMEAISAAFNAELEANCEDVSTVQTNISEFEGEDNNAQIGALRNALASEGYTGIVGYELNIVTNAANAVIATRTRGPRATLVGFALGEDTLGAIEIGGLTAAVVADPASLGMAAIDAATDLLVMTDRDAIEIDILVIDASIISTVRCDPGPCDP